MTASAPPPRSTDDPAAAADTKSFQALRTSGAPRGASVVIGTAIGRARDAVARALLRIGATPNRVTILGFLFTCGAGYCLLRGAGQQVPYFVHAPGPIGWWPLVALVFLTLAGACDMLDGAIARVGRCRTRAGGVLDSTVDRFSDIAVCLGCCLYFGLLPRPNLTYQLLAVLTLCNSTLTSYIKARAENIIPDCSVGYWLRGERCAAFMIGCACGHVPAVLWQLSISGFFTVWRRATYAYGVVHATDAGRAPPPRGPVAGWLRQLQLWRHPRGSLGYDLITGAHIAFIIIGPWLWPALLAAGATSDPLRAWLQGG